MNGPVPRGWRRCKWRCDDGSTCDARFQDGPENSVVALCEYHTYHACPRGDTHEEARAAYLALIEAYGWKAS